jgi:transcriptional regulatory protein GAL4
MIHFSNRSLAGVASGAALLRLADSGSVPPNNNGTRNKAVSVPRTISPPPQLDGYLDAYFRLYHVSYPIIHEPTFRAHYMEVIPRPSHTPWQVLLYIVAAIGAFTASDTPSDIDLALFEAAKARLSIDILETGNIIVVQALTLISNYLQKRNKPNSGYNYMGLARRIAMGIGLHKEFCNWEASRLKLEMRRRTWWCLYVFDIGAIITFSRPMDFPQGGIEVELPLNVHDAVS